MDIHNDEQEYLARGGQTIKTFSDPADPNPTTIAHFPLPEPISTFLTPQKPVLEVLTIDFKPELSESEISQVASKFVKYMNDSGDPGSFALSVEDPKKGLMAYAWESVDKHNENRETEAFKKEVPAVRDIWTAPSMMHVKLHEVTI